MIITLGEILVEIMADTPGHGFAEPMALTGPYPSGAPAIYISQVARMGVACGIISAVGADDFGRVNLNRLRADRVDVSAVAVDSTRPADRQRFCALPPGWRARFRVQHRAFGLCRDCVGG